MTASEAEVEAILVCGSSVEQLQDSDSDSDWIVDILVLFQDLELIRR